MIGTVVNAAAIIIGSLFGIFLHGKLPTNIQKTVIKGISLAVLLIGMQMAFAAGESKELLVVIFSLVLGGIIGEIIHIECRLNSFGETLKNRYKSKNELFAQGFVQASLIYCVGAMAIMGAIQDGLNNDPSILFTKSLLDGISSIAFAATYGAGVLLSALPVFLYQGSISLLAFWTRQLFSEPVITAMTSTGGLLIFAIGLNMMGVAKIKIGNLLPSLFVAIILAEIVF